jgi:hypothetical protein
METVPRWQMADGGWQDGNKSCQNFVDFFQRICDNRDNLKCQRIVSGCGEKAVAVKI